MTTEETCKRCGKMAFSAPLCLACLLEVDSVEYARYNALQIVLDEFPQDEGSECKMCGKPNVYNSPDGMCGTCRQIWNG
jgi:ribosomal protein L37E